MRRLVFGVVAALLLGCGGSTAGSDSESGGEGGRERGDEREPERGREADDDDEADSTGDGALKCKSRAGRTYRVSYVERSGDCGPITEEIVTAEVGSGTPGSVLPVGCISGSSITSADGCEAVSKDLVCSGGGQTAKLNGKISWNAEGSAATGLIAFEVQLQNGTCSGSYDVTYTEI